MEFDAETPEYNIVLVAQVEHSCATREGSGAGLRWNLHMNAWRVARLSLVQIALEEVEQPVEPPGAQQSAVKYVQPVRPANHEDAFAAIPTTSSPEKKEEEKMPLSSVRSQDDSVHDA